MTNPFNLEQSSATTEQVEPVAPSGSNFFNVPDTTAASAFLEPLVQSTPSPEQRIAPAAEPPSVTVNSSPFQALNDTFASVANQLVRSTIAFTRDAAIGTLNLTLGASGGAPIPFAETPEEERELRAAGWRQIETPEQRAQQQIAGAVIASSLAGGPIGAALRRIPQQTAREVLTSLGAGAVFGAARPKAEEESLLEATVVDALAFGGFHFAGALLRRKTTPVALPDADDLVRGSREVARETRREIAATPTEYGRAVYEEASDIAGALRATALAPAATSEIAGSVTMASSAHNINPIRRILGSPSSWARTRGPAGDAAGRIVQNSIDREQLAMELRAEWRETIRIARETLHKGQSRRGKRQRELALGELLDSTFAAEQLPPGTTKQMQAAFGIMRNKFLADREALRLLVGADADWGINAYMAHVFVGEYAIKDAATGGTLAIVGPGQIKKTAADLVSSGKATALRVEPKNHSYPTELLSGSRMSPRQFHAFARQTADALTLDAQEVADMLLQSGAVRLPGKKFFANVLQRRSNLQGFEANPFRAAELYSVGFSRKIAYHDFEQKAGAVIDALAQVPGTKSSQEALKTYVNHQLGRPGVMEQMANDFVAGAARVVSKAVPEQQRPVVAASLESMLSPRNISATINSLEAIARLGYSPVAVATNLTQTVINTVPSVGLLPTIRAVRLLADRSQRAKVDVLLRQMGVDVALPLSVADDVLIKSVRDVGPLNPLYLFNKAETANRAVAGLASYQKGLLDGASGSEALALARNSIRDTQFIYGPSDTPMLFQGPVGGTFFQFQKFFVKEFEFILRTAQDPVKAAKFAIAMQSIGGISALLTLPPFSIVDWATGKLTGATLKERAQDFAPRASRGFPGMLGFDISANVSVGLPTDVGSFTGPAVGDIWAIAAEALPAAAAELISEKGGELSPEEWGKIVRQITPVVIRRAQESFDIYNTGAVRQRGTGVTIFEPQNKEAEAVMNLFGVRSLERAQESDENQALGRALRSYRGSKEAWTQRIVRAALDGDFDKARQLRLQAAERGIVIRDEALEQRIALSGQAGRITRQLLRAPGEVREQLFERLPPELQP